MPHIGSDDCIESYSEADHPDAGGSNHGSKIVNKRDVDHVLLSESSSDGPPCGDPLHNQSDISDKSDTEQEPDDTPNRKEAPQETGFEDISEAQYSDMAAMLCGSLENLILESPSNLVKIYLCSSWTGTSPFCLRPAMMLCF